MNNKIKFTMVLALLIQASSAAAAVPGLINFQGRLLDANKLPRTGTFAMTFKICDSLAGACNTPCAVGNACSWTEDQNLTVTNGVFAAQLGAVTPIDPNAFSAAARYLDITVAGETLSPRERLAAGAFSFKASAADALATPRAINGVNFDGSAAITVPVNSADDTANASTVYPLWTATAAGNNAAKVSTSKLSFVPNTGILTATGFSGNFTGTVTGSAATLTTPRAINGVNFDGSAAITVPVNSADDTASASPVYPLWTTAAGNTAAKLSTSRLSFVPNTGVLTAGGFAGPLTGNITGNASGSAGTLATPRAINGVNFDGSAAITVPVNSADDTTNAAAVYPLWTTAAGNTAAKLSTTKLSFVPNTGILTATGFAGAGGSLTGLSAGNFSAGTLAAARGGTGADLSASAVGALPYFSATGVMSGLAAGSANQLLRSAGGAAPTWTTATYPNTTTINQILYSNAANTVTGLATANSGLLVTGASGIPAIGTDIPTAVTIGGAYVYRAGGTDVAIADGGTGQATATLAFNALAPTTTKGDIIVEDGTNVVRQAVGANNTVLMADSAQTTGIKWAAPYLARYTAAAGANVTINTANTWYTGTSVAVAAGTYLITAHITMGKAAATVDNVYARIYNGTTALASGMAHNPVTNPHATTITMTTIATVGAVTLSVQGTSSVATALIYAALPTNGQGNNATQITAIALQ